jgi:CRP-like cAMP-binding protein
MLYSQGDIADEVYFVGRGTFTLYADLASVIDLPDGLIDDTE